MARSVSAVWVIAVAVVVLAAGLGAGYLLGRGAGGTAANGGGGSPATLSILAAGTLGTPFGSIASYLANTSTNLSAPTTAQQYKGSLAVVSAVSQLHEAFDVVATADYRLIPQQLEPAYAGWEVVFGSSPESLVYDPTVTALQGINSTNWAAKVLSSGLPIGLANASVDPNGYNEIFVLELEGLHEGGTLSTLYDHFFTTPVGSYAIANPSTTRVELESNVASLIQTHTVALYITYRSYAVSHGLSYVDLDPSVGLGSLASADLQTYARASTTIQPTTGPQVLHGAPILFSVTVPSNAPQAWAGLAFLHVLFSPAGSAILAAHGLTPILPGWCDRPSAVPGVVAPEVIALPSSLPPPTAP